MSHCRKHSFPKTSNQSFHLCPSQCKVSVKYRKTSVQAIDYLSSNSAQTLSLLSPLLPPHQHSHHDSASHFNSPLLPGNLQPPSEPHSHCKGCTSLHLREGERRVFGAHKHMQSFSKPAQLTSVSLTSSELTKSPTDSPPAFLTSSSPHPSNSPLTQVAPSSSLYPALYESGDLTYLNHCLHHIVHRRISSPTLSTNHPMHSNRGATSKTTSICQCRDSTLSLDAPLFSRPNLNRTLHFSPHDTESKQDSLVGEIWRLHVGSAIPW